MTMNRVFRVVALVCFVLAAFGVGGILPMVPVGLAFFVAADLV